MKEKYHYTYDNGDSKEIFSGNLEILHSDIVKIGEVGLKAIYDALPEKARRMDVIEYVTSVIKDELIDAQIMKL